MYPDYPIFVFSGSNCLPAGGEERPGEFEERPCEEDQNAGVCAETREASVLLCNAASAHPQHTQIPQLVCSTCILYTPKNKFLPEKHGKREHGSRMFSQANKSMSVKPAQCWRIPECSSAHLLLCERS